MELWVSLPTPFHTLNSSLLLKLRINLLLFPSAAAWSWVVVTSATWLVALCPSPLSRLCPLWGMLTVPSWAVQICSSRQHKYRERLELAGLPAAPGMRCNATEGWHPFFPTLNPRGRKRWWDHCGGEAVPTHAASLHWGLLLWAELSPLPAPCPFCWDSATMGNVLRALTGAMATDPPLEDAGH